MRFLHKLWAGVAGYFWLPCPKCGDMFGGHETGNTSLADSEGIKWVCCRKHDADIHCYLIEGVGAFQSLDKFRRS